MSEGSERVEFKQNFWKITMTHLLELVLKLQFPFIILTLTTLIMTVGMDYADLVNAIGITGDFKTLIYFPFYIIFVILFIVTAFALLLMFFPIVLIIFALGGILIVDLLIFSLITPNLSSDAFNIIFIISVIIILIGTIKYNIDTLKYMFKPLTFKIYIDIDKRKLILKDGQTILIDDKNSVILRRRVDRMSVFGYLRKRGKQYHKFIIWELVLIDNNREITLFTNKHYYPRIQSGFLGTEGIEQIRGQYYWDWMDDAAEFISTHLKIQRIDDTGIAYLLAPNEEYGDLFNFSTFVSFSEKRGKIPIPEFKYDINEGNSQSKIKEVHTKSESNEVKYKLIEEGYRVKFKPNLAFRTFGKFTAFFLIYFLLTQIVVFTLGLFRAPAVLFNLLTSAEVIFFLILLITSIITIIQYVMKSKIIDIDQEEIVIGDKLGPLIYRKTNIPLTKQVFLVSFKEQLEIRDSVSRIQIPGVYDNKDIMDIQKSLAHILKIIRSLSQLFDYKLETYECYECGAKIDRAEKACPSCNTKAPNCIICFIDPSPEQGIVRYQCCNSYAHYSHAIQWNESKNICPYCKSESLTISKVG